MKIEVNYSKNELEDMKHVLEALIMMGIRCEVKPLMIGDLILKSDTYSPVAKLCFRCSRREWIDILQKMT